MNISAILFTRTMSQVDMLAIHLPTAARVKCPLCCSRGTINDLVNVLTCIRLRGVCHVETFQEVTD